MSPDPKPTRSAPHDFECSRGEVEGFSLDRLLHLITMTQCATDILLNEIERRGKLTFVKQTPIMPYMSDYYVETILTRP